MLEHGYLVYLDSLVSVHQRAARKAMDLPLLTWHSHIDHLHAGEAGSKEREIRTAGITSISKQGSTVLRKIKCHIQGHIWKGHRA